jgi:hypothetical protein
MINAGWYDLSPLRAFEHCVRGNGFDVRHMPHPRATASCDREDQLHIGRIDLLVSGDAHRPAKAARTQCLSEWSGQPVTGIGQYTTEAHARSDDTIDLLDRDLGLGAIFLQRAGTPALSMRAVSLVQLSGRNSRKLSMSGTSPEASVTDTSVWQFAFLPSAVAYWGATPTEALPFLGRAVSSMISQAPLPPTNSSAWRHKVASSGRYPTDRPR